MVTLLRIKLEAQLAERKAQGFGNRSFGPRADLRVGPGKLRQE